MFYSINQALGRALAVLTLSFGSSVVLFAADPAPSPSAADLLSAPVEVGETVTDVEPTQKAAPKDATAPAGATDAQGANKNSPSVIPPAAPGAAATTPSLNLTINLINRLVQRGVLTKEDAEELMHQAEEDVVRAQEAAAIQTASAPPPPSDDEVRVTYVPQVVKDQIRDEIKQEVMEEAREQNWAAPNAFPEWVSRFRLFGDVRVRYEGDFYPSGNDNTGAFPNFNAINTGPPFDVTGTVFSPQYNVDQDRNRFRLRARAGALVELGEGFTAGLRIATGEDNSPVSPNQTLGVANQKQGGNYSKYEIWLDRAFIRYELGGTPQEDLVISVGRFDNPFLTTNMIWDDDLGFDGLALEGRYEVVKGVTPFVVAGAFPVFNTDLNFSTNQPSKFPSEDKYLFGGQAGLNWQINRDLTVKLAVAYYDFQNIEGKLSSPFTPLTPTDQGDTDDSRPSFAQRGNTYFPIRDIVPTPGEPPNGNANGTKLQFQYFGLVTPFRELAVTGRLDFSRYDPVHFTLEGEFVTNLAFDYNHINGIAVNNRGPNTVSGAPGNFEGGNKAGMIQLRAGSPTLNKRWAWNVGIGYRYVESDATVDGFADSDFGGGGTNLQGFTIGGQLALSPHVWLTLRWLSADAIAGPTYKNDIIQFDINARF
jgi:hypothetical protein